MEEQLQKEVDKKRAEKEAERIIREEEGVSEKSRLVVSLLCWFLGYLGVHRFYAGKTGTGLLMLFTLGGFGIWWLIDDIITLTGNLKDGEGRKISEWQPE